MVHRQKHNEHFLTLIDHGTVPRRERMPRVLGALTVSYNSSVNWLERCFDYHYDCDPYAYNVFNTVVSYITYLRHKDISYPFFPISKDHLPILYENNDSMELCPPHFDHFVDCSNFYCSKLLSKMLSFAKDILLVLCPRRTINNFIENIFSYLLSFYLLL